MHVESLSKKQRRKKRREKYLMGKNGKKKTEVEEIYVKY